MVRTRRGPDRAVRNRARLNQCPGCRDCRRSGAGCVRARRERSSSHAIRGQSQALPGRQIRRLRRRLRHGRKRLRDTYLRHAKRRDERSGAHAPCVGVVSLVVARRQPDCARIRTWRNLCGSRGWPGASPSCADDGVSHLVAQAGRPADVGVVWSRPMGGGRRGLQMACSWRLPRLKVSRSQRRQVEGRALSPKTVVRRLGRLMAISSRCGSLEVSTS